MEEAEYQPSIHTSYSIDRNLAEFLRFIKMRLAEGKVVTIADNAYANGADLSLIQLLNSNGLLLKSVVMQAGILLQIRLEQQLQKQ